MRIIALALSFIAIAGTVLPIFRESFWWIRIFDYPQLQIALLSLFSMVLVLAAWGYRNKLALVLSFFLLASFAYKVPHIIRYTPLTAVNARYSINKEGPNCLRILQSNVKMDNRKAVKVKALVYRQDPDILLINEPDHWWMDQLSELDSIYPYSLKQPQDNTYGMILYSKLPLLNTEINFLVKEDVPSMFATVVLPDGKQFDLYCLHPEPPKPGSDTYERDAELLLVGKRIRETNKPAIVVGDLNDVAWSYTSELFQRYSELLDPREGRGFYNTYNVFIPLFRYPLDHFFYSKEFGLVKLEKLQAVGSDHFPIQLDVCLEESVDHSQNQDSVDGEDLENVEEKIEDGKNNGK
jgi:endonuclease/exonuclease/phosphatase (EEP) superfamily protein YafD